MAVHRELNRLPECEWKQTAASHLARAEKHTQPARIRRDYGQPHPVEDFLFQYYPYPFALLELWHPGYGFGLEWRGSGTLPFSEKHYSVTHGYLAADLRRLTTKERQRLNWISNLLSATQHRPPNFACHGLHEWAMVYRGKEVRHENTASLRLSKSEIDAVVESRAICCSHYDAFRFFAPEARPMNRLQPTLDDRTSNEQPGCVHANMDLYKWAAKSMPWIGSDLLLDCFELAMELRDLDMRASPYDLTRWAREPILIETAAGRKFYEAEQRRMAEKANPLRSRLIAALAIFEHWKRGE